MEVVENVLASSSSANYEQELARDSSAAVSVVSWEQRWLGAALSSDDGSPSLGFRVLQVLVVSLSILGGATTAQNSKTAAGMEQPNELLEIFGLLTGVAYLLLVFPLGSARIALRPDSGALAQLGAGTQKISDADARSLARWRALLRAITVMFFMPGLIGVVTSIRGVDGMTKVALPTQIRLYRANLGLCCFLVVPILFNGWWSSMSTASCLCRDSVIDAIRNVRRADTSAKEQTADDSDSWEKDVAAPALALRTRLELLSEGWSSGLLGMSGFLGVFALGMFMLAINAEYCAGVDKLSGNAPGSYKHILLVLTGLFGSCALLLAKDLASTSSRCEQLVDELNTARIKTGPDLYLQQTWLIESLKELVRALATGSADHSLHW